MVVMLSHLIVGGGCLAAGSVITLAVVGWREDVANWKLRVAQQIRRDADQKFADWEQAQHLVECVETPTSEYRIVHEPVLVRVRSLVADAKAALGPADNPDWSDGELRALIEQHNTTDRSSWPLRRRKAFPTPLDLAARLAALYDPSRELRVIKVRTF